MDRIEKIDALIAMEKAHDEYQERHGLTGFARDALPDMLRAALRASTPLVNKEWPECSGDPASCPENEGYGCCKPNPEANAWRCFHCNEVFTDKEQAALHFGHSEIQQPACRFSIEYIRWLEEQHRRNVEDDTEVLRATRSWASEHEKLRREAEELGYARGLRDAKKHPEELGLRRGDEP